MTSLRHLAVAALAAATALTATAAPADAAKRRTCDQAGGTTVAASESVRLFTKPRARGSRFRALYACHRANGRPFTLSWEYENERWYGLVIGGDRYVAMSEWRSAPVDGIEEATVTVTDVRTRRTVARGSLPGDEGHFQLGLDPPQQGELVVTARGVAAYVTGTGPSRLVVLDRRGVRVVDEGTFVIDPAVAGTLLYWTHGDTARSLDTTPGY